LADLSRILFAFADFVISKCRFVKKYRQIKLKLQLYTLQLAEFPAAFA
jgi:hypothetical protein